MSGLVAACNKRKLSGILKQRVPTNLYGLSGESGACTNYVTGQTPADRRAIFNQNVQIRQTSDGGDRNQSGATGTEQFSEEELGPQGKCNTPEEMEASNKQRDIDYVFVFVVHHLSNAQPLEQVDSNILLYSNRRAREEKGRKRVAYISTKKDIYDKCVEILAELETTDRLDVKAGRATLTIVDDGKEAEYKGMGKRWVVKLKDYLKPKASAVAVAAAASGKCRGSKRVRPTTLIF